MRVCVKDTGIIIVDSVEVEVAGVKAQLADIDSDDAAMNTAMVDVKRCMI